MYNVHKGKKGMVKTLKNVALRDNYGGVLARVLLALVSLLVVGLAVTWVIMSFQKEQKAHQRVAMELSDHGLLEALQKLQESPSWDEGFQKTAHRDGWFSVSILKHTRENETIMSVESTGQSGSVTKKRSYSLKLTIDDQGDSLWIEESRM